MSNEKHEELMNKIVEVINLFTDIPREYKHQSDTADFIYHIHAIQNILYAQMYIKEHGKI